MLTLAQVDGPNCDGCQREISAGETAMESHPGHGPYLCFCYGCGCGIILELEDPPIGGHILPHPFGGSARPLLPSDP